MKLYPWVLLFLLHGIYRIHVVTCTIAQSSRVCWLCWYRQVLHVFMSKPRPLLSLPAVFILVPLFYKISRNVHRENLTIEQRRCLSQRSSKNHIERDNHRAK